MPDRDTKPGSGAPGGGRLRFFNVAPLTDEERDYVHRCVERSGAPLVMTHCYQNAYRTLRADRKKRLTHAEGRAMCGPDPVRHAWLTIGGKVADPTFNPYVFRIGLHEPERVRNHPEYGRMPPPRVPDQYFGAEFERSHVRQVFESGIFGQMLEEADWAALDAALDELKGKRRAP